MDVTGDLDTYQFVATFTGPLVVRLNAADGSSLDGLVTVLDGSPGALSWLGGVLGMRVSPLGTDRFGQTGDLPDLYRAYRLDSNAIVDAAAELFLGN